MGTSVIPTVIDALVTQATAALTGVTVLDGYATPDGSASNFLYIGVDDPQTTQAAQTSDTEQTAATMGTPRSRDQRGTVTCAALSWSGGTDQKAVRDAAYATVAAVENLLRADPALGTGMAGRLVCQLGSETLSQNQYQGDDNTAGGCDALVIFTVAFRARI